MTYNKLLILINNIKNRLKIDARIIFILIICLYLIFTEKYRFHIFLNSLLTIAITVSFIYVNIIKRKFIDINLIKEVDSLNIILIILIILNILNIIVIREVCSVRNIYYLVMIYSTQANLEYCQVSKIFKSKEIKLDRVLLHLSSIILILLSFVIFKLDIIMNEYIKQLSFYLLILINIFIGFYIGINNTSSIILNIEKLYKVDSRKVVIYIVYIVINYINIIVLLIGFKEVIVITMMIRNIILYRVYNYIINKVIKDSLKKINENISLINKSKKDLNSTLIKRNTVLKETNIMIQKSQDRYNELIESIYGAVFLFIFNKLKYANNGILKVVDNSDNQIVGLYLEEFIQKYFQIDLEEIEKSNNYIPCVKTKYNNLDVEIFLTQVNCNTKILYINDITEKNNNTRIIQEMEQYLKEDELKKEFFSNISHELKTPINLIFSAIQVNEIYLKEYNIDGFVKNQNRIKQNCHRLIRTINNFIDANKVSEGYIMPNYRIHNIVEIVENTSIACNKYIKLIDNTLTFDAEKEEIYVKCDKEMIRRIILNILSNSVKYGRKNGNIQINISTKRNHTVYIIIKNDGLKIDEKTIPYIFDKFTKLNKAFNRIKEGSGLGMFLSKALVELQGGNITLITNDNGNEFIITLPIAKNINKVCIEEELEISTLEEKVDIEFSDIYID